MEAAAKAVIVYGDTVGEIARRAEPLISDLEAADAALNGIFDDVVFDRYTAEGAGSRFQAEQKARADAEEAVTALKELAAERRDADLRLATALAAAASVAWDDLDCTVDPVTGTRRDATNDRVMDLFEHFRTGDERGAVLTDDDIFVQTLMRSEHIEAVRQRILADLRSGALTAQDPGFYDRSISDNLGVLANDLLINIPSVFVTGAIPNNLLSGQNLPETFLGSYTLETRVGEPHFDGSVDVTYLINNDTSIESFTRIPLSGGGHIPGPYEVLSDANARNGEWSTHHQLIVWTERVHP